MARSVLIAPSILSANLLKLGEELRSVATADLIHVDVMDGHWVPNLTFGPLVIEATRRAVDLPVDVHLMVDNPAALAEQCLAAGAQWVTFHAEACPLAYRLCQRIHEAGAKAGVAINPATPLALLDSLIDYVDHVLMMSVEPGFSGQAFVPKSLERIRRVKKLVHERNPKVLIEVDGGIGPRNIGEVVLAGADVAVCGSSLFGASDRAATIELLRDRGADRQDGNVL